MVEFDTWRERYAALSFADQVKFHSLIWENYPRQQHYDLACVDAFFAAIPDQPLQVLEIGGWTGDVADHVLDHDERISEWLNVELCKEALLSVALRHPAYGACVQDDFIWNQPTDFFAPYNVVFMSHSIEHLDRRDLMALAPCLQADWLYIDTPLPEDGAVFWMGDASTHKLDMNWRELREFWEARGWTLVGERKNEQEQSMARWFKGVTRG